MGSAELDRARAISFLRRDPFRNVVMLKNLTLFTDHADLAFCEHNGATGVLQLLDTHAAPWDYANYPQTRYVVLLSVTDPIVLPELVSQIPTHCNLIFKLTDNITRAVLQQSFALTRKTAYISYTNTQSRTFTPHPDVIVSPHVKKDCYPLFELQGHSRAEVDEYFATGNSLCFAFYQDAAPLAACFTFQNFEQIHEIGGVYTLPTERRKGHAHKIVTTALHELMKRNRIPRYAVHESNHASIHLAESLGLQSLTTMEHWLYLQN